MAAPIALVTGAGRGLGREVARALAALGFRVLAGLRAGPAPEGTEPLRLDVAVEADVAGAAAEVRARAGRLDLLVNNAGVLLDQGVALPDLDGERLRRTLEVNALGPLRLAQALWPLLPRGGRIVNVSSSGGQLSSPSTWAPAYCLSKSLLNAVTVQLAEAGRPRGVAVNAACPGWVRTEMGGPGAPRSLAEGADTILWLATEAPASLTGAFVRDRKVIPW